MPPGFFAESSRPRSEAYLPGTTLTGTISRLVSSFGSAWGQITPTDEARTVFFNTASLLRSAEFPGLFLGQDVQFDEERDLANGTHAVRLRAI